MTRWIYNVVELRDPSALGLTATQQLAGEHGWECYAVTCQHEAYYGKGSHTTFQLFFKRRVEAE